MGKHELIYQSLTELIDKVHLKPHVSNTENSTGIDFRTDERHGSGANWFGEDWKPSEIVHAIKTGYGPGLDRINEALDKINISDIPSFRRKRSYGDFGDSLDIHKVYTGNLDMAWEKCRASLGSNGKKNITISINVGTRWSYSASEMVWRGAYGSALADAYAVAGHNVEVWGYSSGRPLGRGEKYEGMSIKLLDTCEPFDIEKLASTVCFPGFYRVLGFEAMLTLPFKVDSGFGTSENTPPTHLKDTMVITDIWSLEDIERAERIKVQA